MIHPSCPSKKPAALKKATASFPSRGCTKSLLGDKPSQEISQVPSCWLFFCHQWMASSLPSVEVSTSSCLLLFNIFNTQQFMVAPTCSVYPLSSAPQRCSIRTLLMALPCLLSENEFLSQRDGGGPAPMIPPQCSMTCNTSIPPPLYTFCPLLVSSSVCFCFQDARWGLAAARLNFPLLPFPPEIPQALADLRSIL